MPVLRLLSLISRNSPKWFGVVFPGTTDAGVIVMALRGIQRLQEPLNRLPIVLYLASGLSPDLISVTMDNDTKSGKFARSCFTDCVDWAR